MFVLFKKLVWKLHIQYKKDILLAKDWSSLHPRGFIDIIHMNNNFNLLPLVYEQRALAPLICKAWPRLWLSWKAVQCCWVYGRLVDSSDGSYSLDSLISKLILGKPQSSSSFCMHFHWFIVKTKSSFIMNYSAHAHCYPCNNYQAVFLRVLLSFVVFRAQKIGRGQG